MNSRYSPLRLGVLGKRASCFLMLFGAMTTAAWAADSAYLSRYGLTPSLLYSGDLASDVSGGAARGSTWSGALQLQLAADLNKTLGWQGVTFFVDGLALHGGQPSGLVGDAQGVSNIAAKPDLLLYEAWLQVNIPGVPLSVLVGRYDLNIEFYVLESATVFLNSSFGIGPEFGLSGVAGPSIYPDTSVGVRLDYKPADNVVIRFAALDGVPVDRPNHQWGLFERGDGVLLAGEIAFLTRPAERRTHTHLGRMSNLPPYDDKVAIGGWYYTTSLPDQSARDPSGSPVLRDGSGGVYAILDKTLYHSDANQKILAFLQAGASDDRVNRFGAYLGFGIEAAGFVPGRTSDMMGLGVAMARNGGHFRREQTASTATETSIEFTYYAPVTDWLALHPDIQYVINPGTTHAIEDALVVQFQVEVSL